MTIPDTPDYTNAVVAAQIALGSFPKSQTSAVIDLPPSVTALWLYSGDNSYPLSATVTGVTTGINYPVYPFDTGSTNQGQQVPVICLVSPVLDSQVTVTWDTSSDSDPWYVVGDTSLRVVASLSMGVPQPV